MPYVFNLPEDNTPAPWASLINDNLNMLTHVLSGTYAERPNAGNAGSLHYAYDEGVLAYDNGYIWEPIITRIIQTITAGTRVLNLDTHTLVCDTVSGDINLTLPNASNAVGLIYNILKPTTANKVSVTFPGIETAVIMMDGIIGVTRVACLGSTDGYIVLGTAI